MTASLERRRQPSAFAPTRTQKDTLTSVYVDRTANAADVRDADAPFPRLPVS
jgi:hypothetical protein